MGNCDAEIDCEVDRVIDEILREDRLESMGLDPRPDLCEANCEEIPEESGKNCAIETSARFSLRILEALRAIQRQKFNDTWPSCSMKEVVQYIRRHYNYDGDLCSQVETALNQVTIEGFVLRMGVNRYHLIGPFANVLNPSTQSKRYLNRSNCRTPSSRRRRRRRRPGTPAANSTCADPDITMYRYSMVSDVEDPQHNSFQNRNNRDRSFLRGPNHGQPFNEDREISMLRQMNPPDPNESLQRSRRERGAGNQGFDNDEDEIMPPVPHQPLRRPGGANGGRGRVIRDHSIHDNEPGINPQVQDQSSDEDVEENQNLVPANEAIQRLGGRDHQLPPEHSSDENMFHVEPAVNISGRGRGGRQHPGMCRRRDNNSSSRSSSDVVIPGCPRRKSRRKNSYYDSSDDTDSEVRNNGEKPWVKNCQNQESRGSKRRGRRCS